MPRRSSPSSSPFDEVLSRSFEFEEEEPRMKKWSFCTTSTTSSTALTESLLQQNDDNEGIIDYMKAPPENLFLEMETIDLESGMLVERHDSIAEINQSMKHLNTIQKDLAGIVASQGEEVERMAYMSIDVLETTEAAASRVMKTAQDTEIRSIRRRGLLSALVVIAVVMGVSWMLIQHQNQQPTGGNDEPPMGVIDTFTAEH